jgi:hypothetical protein
MWAKIQGIPPFVNGAPKPWTKSKAQLSRPILDRVLSVKIDRRAKDITVLKVKI